jgi:hypothetical protein
MLSKCIVKHHQNLTLAHFHHPKKPNEVTSHFHSKSQGTTNLLSVSTDLPTFFVCGTGD